MKSKGSNKSFGLLFFVIFLGFGLWPLKSGESFNTYLILISNFSDYGLSYINLFYNSFFTFLFYPLFWLIFNIYKALIMVKIND